MSDVEYVQQKYRRARMQLDVRSRLGCEWVRCADGERDYPRAVYSIGPGVNKPRPRAKARKAVVADWHRNRTARQRMNFVFNLGARG